MKPHRLPPLDPLQRYSIRETQQYLRVSHQSVYNLINAGELATITAGSRRFVPGSELVRHSRLPPSPQKIAKRRGAG